MKRNPPKTYTESGISVDQAKRVELLLTGQTEALQKLYIADILATIRTQLLTKKK